MKTEKDLAPRKIYKILMKNGPISCVDVVFLNKKKDKILLFKRNNDPVKGIYYTTGGRLLKEETLLECAVRQAKREAGLIINPKKVTFAGIIQENNESSIFKGISYHGVVIFYGYILKNKNVKIKLDEQHSDCKWFSIKDKSIHPKVRERIKQVLLAFNKK